MPEQLRLQINKLKRYACFTAILLCALFILIGLEIEAFRLSASASVKTVFFIMITICAILLICMQLIKKRQKPQIAHQISVRCTNKDALIALLHATQVSDETYLVMLDKENCRLRILVQYISKFDRERLAKQRNAANKKINAQYRVKTDLPFHDALKRMRINLVVCETMSEPLLNWVQRDAANLLSRTESVLNAAIILEQGILLFPHCQYGPTYIEIKKYALAAESLCTLLTV